MRERHHQLLTSARFPIVYNTAIGGHLFVWRLLRLVHSASMDLIVILVGTSSPIPDVFQLRVTVYLRNNDGTIPAGQYRIQIGSKTQFHRQLIRHFATLNTLTARCRTGFINIPLLRWRHRIVSTLESRTIFAR